MSPSPDAVSKLPAGPTKVVRTKAREPELDKIFTLEDIDPIGRIETIIYSPPGGGKTVLASTMPSPFRWIDADGGLKAVRWAFKAGLTSMKSFSELQGYRPTDSAPGYPASPDAFDKTIDMINHWFSPEERDLWKTLVIDSFTAMNGWSLDLGLSLNSRLPKKDRPLSKSHEINLQASLRIITGQQDYKSAMALCEDFIIQVRVECERHNKNLVLICHEWIETSERELSNGQTIKTIVRYEPLLIGQLRERIVKDFDDVWYMHMYNKNGKPDPMVQMHADKTHICKTRWGAIMSFEEPPDYQKMVEKVREYHEAPSGTTKDKKGSK